MNERLIEMQRVAAGWMADADARVEEAGRAIAKRILDGGTVYSFGNGGSASQADHFVAELVGAYENKRRSAFRAISLSSQPATHTSHANDFGYDSWPARFVMSELALRDDDVLLLLTTSGGSANINAALAAYEYRYAGHLARQAPHPLLVVVTGAKFYTSPMKAALRSPLFHDARLFVIDSQVTSRVQEMTLFILHELARHVESSIVDQI